MKHENPYRAGGDYEKGFAFIRKLQVVTRSQLRDYFEKQNKSPAAAIASATVLLSPREKDSGRGKKDSRLGNYSAMGQVYFMQPLAKAKAGDELRFRLRWRKSILSRRDYQRTPIKEVKQIKTSVAKKVISKEAVPVA